MGVVFVDAVGSDGIDAPKQYSSVKLKVGVTASVTRKSKVIILSQPNEEGKVSW